MARVFVEVRTLKATQTYTKTHLATPLNYHNTFLVFAALKVCSD
jgi:hypothetical protein